MQTARNGNGNVARFSSLSRLTIRVLSSAEEALERKNSPDGLLRERRSSESFAFGSRYLKPSNRSFGYPCPLLFGERREHRNHYVLERSGRVEPLLLVGNVTHPFRLKPLQVVQRRSCALPGQAVQSPKD